MQYRAAKLLFWVIAAFGAVAGCSSSASEGPTAPIPPVHSPGAKGSTPIQHVIIVIQENRSFDDFFATFPGANGTTTGNAIAMPSAEQNWCASKNQPVITAPTSVPLTEVSLMGNGFYNNFAANADLAHNYPNGYLTDCDSANGAPNASNPCAMDGFDTSKQGADGTGNAWTCTYTYQYVNPTDIQPYWDMATQYVLADNTFQTQGSESFTAHQDLIAGGTAIDAKDSVIDDPTYWPWGCDAPSSVVTNLITIYGQYERADGPYPCLTYSTMRDLLDAKKVSWKYYAVKIKGGNAGIWSGFDAISAVRSSKEWGTKVTWPNTNIFNDIKHGKLPSVAWITPNGPNSDHPAEKSDTGPSWVASIVNAVGASKYWKSSAIVIVWDDWGGFYDHVQPPFYDNQGGLGFRLPMLIVSPYVQPHVEHTQYETTSIIRFIEDNWNLGTLGREDQRATSIANAFDFAQAPRPYKTIRQKYSLEFFLHQKPSETPPDSE
ncbi:MAG TPA: alkaline phosphatase family protein [Candidatus Binatia bacterium]|nr:alkaline phosphatase family protein [Candidatus Binatia bacterium]